MTKIAIDAMGGDHAPKAPVLGAYQAAQAYPKHEFFLYGQEEQMRNILPGDKPSNLTYVHCEDVITNEDSPTFAVRRKRQASMMQALKAVRQGRCDACISAGNSGALMVGGLTQVKTLRGVERPAFLVQVPALLAMERPLVFLDAGANVDSKVKQLWQNAVIGGAYTEAVFKLKKPRIGLLNNGREAKKGNQLAREGYEVLQADSQLNFIGNVEPHELFKNRCDVLVADGFQANMVLKSMEGTASTIIQLLKKTIQEGSLAGKLGGLLLKADLKNLAGVLDANEAGAGLVFGLRAPVLKCHGDANEQAFKQACQQALQLLSSDLYGQLADIFKAHPLPESLEKEEE